MQPYFFPGISYFNLIHCCDTFVILDDYNFIKKGWINRNRFLENGNEKLISVPLSKASQNKLISEVYTNDIKKFKIKFFKFILNNYTERPILRKLKDQTPSNEVSIAELNIIYLKLIIEHFNLKTVLIKSSNLDERTDNFRGQERIINICKQIGATTYINPIAGSKLYNAKQFSNNDITLKFLSPQYLEYRHTSEYFIPNLSILDLIFNVPTDQLFRYLASYQLENA